MAPQCGGSLIQIRYGGEIPHRIQPTSPPGPYLDPAPGPRQLRMSVRGPYPVYRSLLKLRCHEDELATIVDLPVWLSNCALLALRGAPGGSADLGAKWPVFMAKFLPDLFPTFLPALASEPTLQFDRHSQPGIYERGCSQPRCHNTLQKTPVFHNAISSIVPTLLCSCCVAPGRADQTTRRLSFNCLYILDEFSPGPVLAIISRHRASPVRKPSHICEGKDSYSEVFKLHTA